MFHPKSGIFDRPLGPAETGEGRWREGRGAVRLYSSPGKVNLDDHEVGGGAVVRDQNQVRAGMEHKNISTQ
jgi:hypothetical protein